MDVIFYWPLCLWLVLGTRCMCNKIYVRFKRKPEAVICLLICKQISIPRFTLNSYYISKYTHIFWFQRRIIILILLCSRCRHHQPQTFEIRGKTNIILFSLSDDSQLIGVILHFPIDHISRKKRISFYFLGSGNKSYLCVYLVDGKFQLCAFVSKGTAVSLYPNDPFVCHYVIKIQMPMSLSVTSKPDIKKKTTFVLFSVIMGTLSSYVDTQKVQLVKKIQVLSGRKWHNTTLFLNSDGSCSSRENIGSRFFYFIIYLSGV
jgi:hypothetical protein